MKRVTVRLSESEFQALTNMAQAQSANLSGAIRTLISSHERTKQLLDTLEQHHHEVINAITGSRTAAAENLKRVTQHLTHLLTRNCT